MVVLLLVVALVLGGQTGASKARVSVPNQRPFTVAGNGFVGGERISIAVSARNRVRRTVTAGSGGRFEVRMPAVRLRACPAFALSATGDRGSRASLKIVPACANLQPPGH